MATTTTCNHDYDPEGPAYWQSRHDEFGPCNDDWFDGEPFDPAMIESSCPACGQTIDYCQGHGEMGDPAGYAVLEAHDDGNHYGCHPDGCDGGI